MTLFHPSPEDLYDSMHAEHWQTLTSKFKSVTLDKDSIMSLGQVSQDLRVLLKSYGTKLGRRQRKKKERKRVRLVLLMRLMRLVLHSAKTLTH